MFGTLGSPRDRSSQAPAITPRTSSPLSRLLAKLQPSSSAAQPPPNRSPNTATPAAGAGMGGVVKQAQHPLSRPQQHSHASAGEAMGFTR